MSHTQRLDEVLDATKPGLADFIDREDVRIDEDLASQARLRDEKRWAKVIAGCSDAAEVGEDDLMRDGIIGPMIDVLSDHAFGDVDAKAGRRTHAKKIRDPNVKWDDEVAALRAYANAQIQVRSGDIDRITQRLSLHATIQSSTRNREPVTDPWIHAVERQLATLTDDECSLLWRVHVEFVAPAQRTTTDLYDDERRRRVERGDPSPQPDIMVPIRIVDALTPPPPNRNGEHKEPSSLTQARLATVAKWLSEGRKARADETMVALPRGLPIESAHDAASAMEMAKGKSLPSGSQLQTEGLRWEHLLAEALGMNVSGALGPLDPRKVGGDESGLTEEARDDRRMTFIEASTREVRAMYQAARKRFRDGLLGVVLDTSPKYLIAAPTSRELDRDAVSDEPETVECCAGVHIVEGLRAPCEAVEVEGSGRRHPSRAWPRCDVCGLPVVEVRDCDAGGR